MTTDIRIRTNGNYVAEGTVTVTTPDKQDGADPAVNVTNILVSGAGKPGPVEQAVFVPHGSTVSIEVVERKATEEEIAAGKPTDAAKE